jgi:DnaJ-class molecular chaperone
MISKIQIGFSVTLTQLDGVKFTVQIDDVIECDQVMRVPGKGMPRRSGKGFGDLFITFEIDFPDTLSKKQKDAIKAAFADSSSSGDNEL